MGFHIIENNKDIFKDALQDAIEEALTTIGHNLENYARNNAPVDTGRLKNSIIAVVTPQEQKVTIGSKIDAETNVYYAPYQELGTNRMKAANNGRGYIRPAIKDHFAEFKEIFEDALKDGE